MSCTSGLGGSGRKRGRGALGKATVSGLIKRQGKAYAQIVPDAKKATLQAIIRGGVDPDSVIYSDGFRGYDGLVDVGYDKHFRVRHEEERFVDGKAHVNGVEGFWGVARTRLAKLRGLPKHPFYLSTSASRDRVPLQPRRPRPRPPNPSASPNPN